MFQERKWLHGQVLPSSFIDGTGDVQGEEFFGPFNYRLPMTDLTWATGPDSGCLGLTGNLLVSGGEHLAALDLSSWTLNYLGPGRPREQCLVLTVTTSPLGDAVFFASGALFNLTSRTWTYLPAPPTSFNMALVIQDAKTKRL